MNNRAMFKRSWLRSKQKGNFLVELALALVISTLAIASQISTVREVTDTSLSIGTAQYMIGLQSGINLYATTNNAALGTGVPIAGFAVPLAPTTPELVAGGYLVAGFGVRSPLGLTFKHVLTPSNCPGPACTIVGVSYSGQALLAADGTVRTSVLGIAVARIGVDGSQSFTNAPGTLLGYGGTYSIPNPAGAVAGVIAIRTGDGSGINALLSQYYKLDGSRRLLGNVDVNSFDLNNVKNINSTGTITSNSSVVNNDLSINGTATPGTACVAADVGKVRKNISGDGLVICNANVWEVVGNAVTGIAAGGACAIRDQFGTSASGIGYVCNGAVWTTAGNFALAGDACAPSGRVATSSATNGQLVCKNGTFINFDSLISKNIQIGPHLLVKDGQIIIKPVCDTGGTPTPDLKLVQAAVDVATVPPYQSTYIAAQNNGASWTILLRLKRSAADGGGEVSGNAYGLSGIFTAECSY